MIRNDKIIGLDSLISMEIGHFKGDRLICDIAQKGLEQHFTSFNHDLDYDDDNELLSAIQAKAIHGKVSIEDCGSLFYQPGTEHPGSDMISYTVRSNKGCVGSLAIIIKPEANQDATDHHIYVHDDEDEFEHSESMLSSIALKITAKDKNDVVFVDSFMLDINDIGSGRVAFHNQLSSGFEVYDQDDLYLWEFGEDEHLKLIADEFESEEDDLEEDQELSLENLNDIPYKIYC
ncbi:MAG: hypothetical protein P8Y43_08730 [Sulfurovaceae bacterium]